MTGRNPAGTEDFPSPDCSDVAHGPQRLNLKAEGRRFDPAPDHAEFQWLALLPAETQEERAYAANF